MCATLKLRTAFQRRAASGDGRDSRCKACRNAYFREYISRNRRAYNAWATMHREANRERLRTYQRAYQRRRRALMKAGEWMPRQRA